jgi:hypothetical protein
LDSVIPGLVWDEPDGVGSSMNGICFDLELYDSEIMENIGAGNVENDCRVSWHPEEVGVCVIIRISENPIELVTRDIESWAALSRDLGLIVGGNAKTPGRIWRVIGEKRVHRGK